MPNKILSIPYFRNFIFGVEDSLVSTVGLLSGIAVADIPKSTILLTGIILIFVEAISMTAGSFLSEHSVHEYVNRSEKVTKVTLVSSLIMFFSYFLSGFLTLFPYVVFPVTEALEISITISIILLFILGIVGAKISKTNIIKGGLRMAMVGGIAISVGVLCGNWLSNIK